MLFDRSGGKLTETMAEKIALSNSNNVHAKLLLKEVRKIWDEWDLQERTGNSLGPSMSFYPDFISILSQFYLDFVLILSKFYPYKISIKLV